MTNTLEERLKGIIRATGPMDVATYMQLCLTDPEDGYYTTKEPFGGEGDFITAPEVSQLFGEMIGIWVIDIWQKMGKPQPFCLAEAGPGRGTLMADILRTLEKAAPDCAKAVDVTLIEVSDRLRALQRQTLAPNGRDASWIGDVSELSNQPAILIANEFLDALPIHQYQYRDGAWHERAIGLDENDDLTWGLKPASPMIPRALAPEQDAVFELCPAGQTAIASICDTMKRHDGAALIIDYGHLEPGLGDTFQAVKDHAYYDPLVAPGEADLTAHVDFSALARIVESNGLAAHMSTQGAFLIAMGLLERAGALGQGRSPEIQSRITTDVERLAAPDKMGDLFKVMSITAKGVDPHGF
ncbi:MAG: class I SAM-dependent methyltransferase [Pseudomonadota bacterium]